MIRKDSWYDFSLLKFAKICFLAYLSYNVGDLASIPGLGRSSGEGNGNLLQYSCLGLYRQVQVQSMGLQRVGHDFTFTLTFGVLRRGVSALTGL